MTETWYAAQRLVKHLASDDRAAERIFDYAQVLPPAAFFTVRAQVAEDRKRGRQRRIRNETAWVLSELQRLVVERVYVRAA